MKVDGFYVDGLSEKRIEDDSFLFSQWIFRVICMNIGIFPLPLCNLKKTLLSHLFKCFFQSEVSSER